jgi:hypothetical protein
MYLTVEQQEKAEEREWQVKMAFLTSDPDRFGPVVFPTKEKVEDEDEIVIEELQPGDLTAGGFHPDIKVKYKNVPTQQEVEETLAQFPQEQVLGLEDFRKFAPDERLANGSAHTQRK